MFNTKVAKYSLYDISIVTIFVPKRKWKWVNDLGQLHSSLLQTTTKKVYF